MMIVVVDSNICAHVTRKRSSINPALVSRNFCSCSACAKNRRQGTKKSEFTVHMVTSKLTGFKNTEAGSDDRNEQKSQVATQQQVAINGTSVHVRDAVTSEKKQNKCKKCETCSQHTLTCETVVPR